jgi:hypothetical protein
MMEMVSKTLGLYPQLTQLDAREDFIEKEACPTHKMFGLTQCDPSNWKEPTKVQFLHQ